MLYFPLVLVLFCTIVEPKIWQSSTSSTYEPHAELGERPHAAQLGIHSLSSKAPVSGLMRRAALIATSQPTITHVQRGSSMHLLRGGVGQSIMPQISPLKIETGVSHRYLGQAKQRRLRLEPLRAHPTWQETYNKLTSLKPQIDVLLSYSAITSSFFNSYKNLRKVSTSHTSAFPWLTPTDI